MQYDTVHSGLMRDIRWNTAFGDDERCKKPYQTSAVDIGYTLCRYAMLSPGLTIKEREDISTGGDVRISDDAQATLWNGFCGATIRGKHDF